MSAARTNPGSELMIEVFRLAGPSVILLDQLVMFARQLDDARLSVGFVGAAHLHLRIGTAILARDTPRDLPRRGPRERRAIGVVRRRVTLMVYLIFAMTLYPLPRPIQ